MRRRSSTRLLPLRMFSACLGSSEIRIWSSNDTSECLRGAPPPTCGRDSSRGVLAPHHSSYRKCFSQNPFTRPLRQGAGREEIYSYAQELLKGDLKSDQIKKRGARQGINQEVEVAIFAVAAVQDGPKD